MRQPFVGQKLFQPDQKKGETLCNYTYLHYICTPKTDCNFCIHMEAKDSLIKILKSLLEIDAPLPKTLLVDFLSGKESNAITEARLDEKETFGCGDSHEEDYWSDLIDTACERGYLKFKNVKLQTLVVTPQGKKFLKEPTSFPIDEERDMPVLPADKALDEIVQNAMKVHSTSEASPRTKQQMKLIHAIDCKVALDDFAENESLGLDEVLDEAEKLVRQGRPLDITYFTDEVIGPECVDELVSYFRNAPSDNLDDALAEYGDVYNDMEIRLARLVYRVGQLAKK